MAGALTVDKSTSGQLPFTLSPAWAFAFFFSPPLSEADECPGDALLRRFFTSAGSPVPGVLDAADACASAACCEAFALPAVGGGTCVLLTVGGSTCVLPTVCGSACALPAAATFVAAALFFALGAGFVVGALAIFG